MPHYITRSQAAQAALKKDIACFRTRPDPTHRGYWMYNVVSGPSAGPDAKEWASTRDYVAWVEVDFRDSGHTPGYDSVLVITCFLEEVPAEDMAEIKANGWKIQPITPSLFTMVEEKNPLRDTTGRSKPAGAPREKSSAESPTKLVWEIASSMPTASKADIVAACVARGIHPSTAQTQYYKWAKAQKG